MKAYFFTNILQKILPAELWSDLGSLLSWLLSAFIETAIISLIVALIAKFGFDKEFSDIFKSSFLLVGILEIILGISYIFY